MTRKATPAPAETPADAPAADAPTTEEHRPPHGGSFIRQENGSLQMIEGAIVPADVEPDTDQPADAGEQSEG